MQFRGPLMMEHRLIERLIELIKTSVGKIQEAAELAPAFIETTVDFLSVYADRTHHGKEESILFRELASKNLVPEHAAMMHDLIVEHRYARDLTAKLVEAGRAAFGGHDPDARGLVISLLMSVAEFYPRHITKEDEEFFPAAMAYFDESEKQALLDRFWEFDRLMIHEKYQSVVKTWEARE